MSAASAAGAYRGLAETISVRRAGYEFGVLAEMMKQKGERKMIAVFLADGFEETEALTTVDILRRAELEVRIVGVGGRMVTGSHGITVQCDATCEELSPQGLTMIVLPGGMPGTLHLEHSPEVGEFIRFAADRGLWIGAICAAPSILGHMGLLRGRRATCFAGYEEQLEGAEYTGAFVEQDGRLVTAKGMGVTVEFALRLVECLLGSERAAVLKASLQCRE